MFDKPVRVNSILLLPAERADVIVDFTGLGGQDLVLNNLPLPAGVVSPAEPELPELMQFRVRGLSPRRGRRRSRRLWRAVPWQTSRDPSPRNATSPSKRSWTKATRSGWRSTGACSTTMWTRTPPLAR